MLRLAALRMLSESSLSGADLQVQIVRNSGGEWRPGPGSTYFILAELLRKGLIVELPKRAGTTRRYVISTKGREELSRLSKDSQKEVGRQLKLLSSYAQLSGKEALRKTLLDVAKKLAD
jgi:DNA-binding PadR family transcriptional regulator